MPHTQNDIKRWTSIAKNAEAKNDFFENGKSMTSHEQK